MFELSWHLLAFAFIAGFGATIGYEIARAITVVAVALTVALVS